MWDSNSGPGRTFFLSALLALPGLLGSASLQGRMIEQGTADEANQAVLASLPTGVRELAGNQRARLAGEPATRGGTTVTLRVGSGCTYSSVQAAIDAASSSATTTTVIRLRTAIYTEAIQIGSKNIDIIGGHANCTTTTPNDTSTIRNPSGNNASTILFAPGTGGGTNERTLRLSNLHIRRGSGVSISPGGGITVLPVGAARGHVELDSVVIRQNEGLRGGGIALLQQGSALGGSLVMVNTSIRNNDVTGANPHGGGLYCSGDGYGILKIGGEIHSNTAGVDGSSTGRGGGIFLDAGCQLGWFAQGPAFGEARLAENIAYGIGGGLFASNGAEASLYGQHFFANSSSRPLRIQDNVSRSSAQGGGAGIASINGATVDLFATWTEGNRAEHVASGSSYGGAGRVTGGGRLSWHPTTAGNVPCHDRQRCSLIRNNRAGTLGAIVYVSGNNSLADINRTWASHNYNTDSPSSGSIVAFSNGRVSIRSSVLTRAEKFDQHPNPARPTRLVHLSGGRVDLIYSTVANHSLTVAPFLFMGINSQLYLRGSIIQEPAGLALGQDNAQGTPLIDSDCVLWSDPTLANIPADGAHTRNLLTTNPGFLGPEEFRLAEGSPAIDYCNSQMPDFGNPPEFDLTGRPRGIWTTPGILGESPLHGPFDLGAFEMPVDRLFHSRFEAGPGPI